MVVMGGDGVVAGGGEMEMAVSVVMTAGVK